MLIIHSINPTGAFSYGDVETLDVETRGVINLRGQNEDSGGSNGSGKTSLFNALCVLLFGENPTGVKDIDVPNAVWGKGMALRCEFTSWENIRYRITYCRDWKSEKYKIDNDNNVSYLGTSLFLDKLENNNWIDCRGKSMKETRAMILNSLGITYDQFLSIAYMSHRVGNKFLRGTNKDRIDTLTRITGVSEWDQVLDRARYKKRSLKADSEAIERDISHEQGAKREINRQLDEIAYVDWDQERKNIENELKTFRKNYKEELEKVKGLKKEIETLVIQRDSSYSTEFVEDVNRQISEKNSKILELERSKNDLDYSVDASLIAELKQLEKDCITAESNLNIFQGENGSFLDMKNCPTCGTKITKTKQESIKKKVKELERVLENRKKDYEKKKAEYDNYLEKAQKQSLERRNEFNSDIEILREEINNHQLKIQSELQRYNELDSEIREKNSLVEHIENKLLHIKRSGELKTSELSNIDVNIKKIGDLKLRIRDCDNKIDKFNDKIEKLNIEISVYDWLIINIPYIKLHKLAVSMEELSNLINENLMGMGDTIRVNISSFDEKVKKKNAADVKDLLKSEVKVEITDGSKKIDPKLYSDGEISKISNAFIRGLNELARKFGYGCNVMLLDEVFSFIDEDNSQKLSDSFKRNMQKLGTVFVTDNSGVVDNLLSFDEVWVARKNKGKTSIELVA